MARLGTEDEFLVCLFLPTTYVSRTGSKQYFWTQRMLREETQGLRTHHCSHNPNTVPSWPLKGNLGSADITLCPQSSVEPDKGPKIPVTASSDQTLFLQRAVGQNAAA